MKEGYEKGILIEECFYDVLCCIFGLKVKLGLYNYEGCC